MRAARRSAETWPHVLVRGEERPGSSDRPLQAQEELAALRMAAVRAEAGSGRNHSVAGDPQLGGTDAQGVAGRAPRARPAGSGGDVAVRAELAVRDGDRRLVDRARERRAGGPEVHRHAEGPGGPREVRAGVLAGRGQRALRARGPRPEPLLDLSQERSSVRGEPGRDDPDDRGDDRELAERRVDRREAEAQIGGHGNGRTPGSGSGNRPSARSRPSRSAVASTSGSARSLPSSARVLPPGSSAVARWVRSAQSCSGIGSPTNSQITVRSFGSSEKLTPWSINQIFPSSPSRQCPALRSALLMTTSKRATRRKSSARSRPKVK